MKKTEAYNFLEKKYNELGYNFVTVVTHLLDIGFRTASNITKERIEADRKILTENEAKLNAEGRFSFFTPDYICLLNEQAMEIAKNVQIHELISFLQKKKIFE